MEGHGFSYSTIQKTHTHEYTQTHTLDFHRGRGLHPLCKTVVVATVVHGEMVDVELEHSSILLHLILPAGLQR